MSAGLGHSKCYGSRERRYRSASDVSKSEERGAPPAEIRTPLSCVVGLGWHEKMLYLDQ